MSEKKPEAKALSEGVKPRFRYSWIWRLRNVSPIASVRKRPTISPNRWSRLIETSAQCIVNDDEIRIAVLIPVASTGSSMPAGGHVVCVKRM